MSSTQVIKAAQMFTKNGNSKNVSVVKEIVIGLSLGLVGGVAWKTYHWNEKRKIEEYYYAASKAAAKS